MIFYGPPGTGKTTVAEIAAALKGADPNATTEELVRYALRAMVMKG